MTSPQIHPQPVDYLLRELERLTAENRKLRRRVQWLRESRTEWKRRAQSRLAKPKLARDDPRHGTANGYNNLSCRCAACKSAWNEYCKAYAYRTGRHRPLDEYLASIEGCDSPHGTEARYTNGGCRCDECKQASAAARRRRRAALPPEEQERIRAADRERKRRTIA